MALYLAPDHEAREQIIEANSRQAVCGENGP
jgi:hypothetical protein